MYVWLLDPDYVFLLVVSPFGSAEIVPAGVNSSVGSIARLVCSGMGGPNNTFSWERKPEGEEIATRAVLNVSIINATDGGEYSCTVSNAAGSDNTSIIINGTLNDHRLYVLA